MTPDDLKARRTGLTAALFSYISWGLIVIYFKLLAAVDAPRILAHRSLWAAVCLALIITAFKGWPKVRAAWADHKVRNALLLTSVLIGSNWLVFIWAVNAGHVLAGSLGYYINPLMNVVLGVWLLGERLSRWQIVAVGLAALGVLNQAVAIHGAPIISLFLAATFAAYGLIRKKTPVDAQTGLFIEMGLLTVPAVIFLGWYAQTHGNPFSPADPKTVWLLLASGLITTIPLMLFAVAVRNLSLTALGAMQYIAPSIQFLLGVVVYHEAFQPAQAVTFGLIWTALAIFMVDAIARERKRLKAAV